MINAQTRIALAFTAGVCVGGGIGYLIADHHIKKLAAQDLAAVQEMFRRVREDESPKQESVDEDSGLDQEEDSYQTPAEGIAAEKVIGLGYTTQEQVERTISINPNYVSPDVNPNDDPELDEVTFEPDPDLEKEVEYVNDITRNYAYGNEADPEDVTTWDRSPDHPYVITEAEYRLDAPEHEKLTLTYYSGDHVLVEEGDIYIPDRNGTVGDDNLRYFGLASGDDNILHVRNERVGADFEVTLNQGKFEHVIGFGLDEEAPPKRVIRKMRNSD